MNLFKKIPIAFEGKDYEIWLLYEDNMINVVAFLDNHPANGYRYQIQIPKQVDVKKFLKIYPVEELVEKAKDDVVEKRWEKLLPLMNE